MAITAGGRRGSADPFGGGGFSSSSSGGTSRGDGTIPEQFTNPLFDEQGTNEGLGMLKDALSGGPSEPFAPGQKEGLKARVSGSIEGGVQGALDNLSASLGGDTSSAIFQLQKSRLRENASSQAGQARADIDIQEQQMRLQLEGQHRAELANLANIEQSVIRDTNAFNLGRAGIGVQQAGLNLRALQQSFAESSSQRNYRLQAAPIIGRYPLLSDYLGAGDELTADNLGRLSTPDREAAFNQRNRSAGAFYGFNS